MSASAVGEEIGMHNLKEAWMLPYIVNLPKSLDFKDTNLSFVKAWRRLLPEGAEITHFEKSVKGAFFFLVWSC